MQIKPIKKAIIAAGGFGSRLLPVTSALPKELLPFLDTPVIHHIVNQCINAGIEEIIIVGKPENRIIESYFKPNEKLEKYLIQNGKEDRLEVIKFTYNNANIQFILQDEKLPYGNARPLYSAKRMIEEGESFVYTYGDDLIYGKGCGIEELVETFNQDQADIVLMCTEVDEEMIPKVGIVSLKENSNIVDHIKEKPKLNEAPSNIASVASYVFNSKIFDLLDPTDTSGDISEFYIQKGIESITQNGKTVACITKGKYLTCGDPLNYLKSTLHIALDRPDLRSYLLKEFVHELTTLKK
ncbi:MAG: UTP--glucose-1-phosphate uridylyltransferase [Patescibacteria group bacterium]